MLRSARINSLLGLYRASLVAPHSGGAVSKALRRTE
jgi:hypothetical protein